MSVHDVDPQARIVIDESMAQVGGGSTFALNLPVYLARGAPQSRFLVLLRNPRVAREMERVPNLEIRVLPQVGYLGLMRFPLLGARKIAAAWAADLWFSAGEYTPEGVDCARVACFQNPTIWTRLPLRWPALQRIRLRALRWLAFRSVANCERVTFLSEDSSRWMGQEIGLPESQRAILPCGIDSDFWRPSENNARSHILVVGSVYEHKNYVRLIEGYTILARRRPDVPDLVIVGKQLDAPYADRVHGARAAAGELAEKIRLCGWVSNEQLRLYYRDAAQFVFPSILETFGIPLVEAMGSRIPLVASDLGCFREVAGEAAFYADPYSPEELAAAMERGLFDTDEIERRLRIGTERAALFTWDNAAEQLLALFGEVLGQRRSGAVRG